MVCEFYGISHQIKQELPHPDLINFQGRWTIRIQIKQKLKFFFCNHRLKDHFYLIEQGPDIHKLILQIHSSGFNF